MNRFLLITKVQLLNVFKQSNKKKSMLNLGSYPIGAIVMADSHAAKLNTKLVNMPWLICGI